MQIACFLGVLSAVFSPFSIAFADEAATSDDAHFQRAHAHFKAGVALYDAKPPDYEGALAEFEAALRDKPSWVILTNIALCDKALHRYPQALSALERAVTDPLMSDSERANVSTAIEELESLVGDVTVTVKDEDGNPAKGYSLKFDGGVANVEGGEHTFRVAVGEHAVEVTGPSDFSKRQTVRVAGKNVAVVVIVVPASQRDDDDKILPSDVLEDDAPGAPPRKLRKFRIEVGPELAYTNLRMSSALGETDPNGKNRGFYGGSLLLRGTRAVSRNVAFGIVGEVGTMTTFSYKSPQGAGNANTALDTWAFGALISVASRGPFQLVSDLSASFFGESAYASTDAGGTYVASGINGAFALDLGARYEWDRVTLGAYAFGDLHSVAAVKDTNGVRGFLDDPGFRIGVRAMLGFRL